MSDYPAAPVPQEPATSTGLDQNVSALLCYLGGWISGLIFLIIEKRNREVRFHAAQSLLLSAGLTVLWIVLTIISSVLFSSASGLAVAVSFVMMIAAIAVFAGWIVLMVFAFQGKRINLPVVGPAAEQMAAKLPG